MKVIIDYQEEQARRMAQMTTPLEFASVSEMIQIQMGRLYSARQFLSRCRSTENGELYGCDDMTPKSLLRFRIASRRFLDAVENLDRRPEPLPMIDRAARFPEIQMAHCLAVRDNEGINAISSVLQLAENGVVVRYNYVRDVVEFPLFDLGDFYFLNVEVNRVYDKYMKSIENQYKEIK